MDFIISVAAMAVVLGVLIVIHELGHHLVAKYFGVRVEVFSVGFGKRLFGFKYGETDYRLSALPLGGYVKMAGENPMEARTGDPGEFASHPRWQRILIALAGPAMNIALAVILLTGIYMVRYEHEKYLEEPATIGFIEAGSPAEKSGLKAGDRIIRFEDLQNPVWEDVYLKSMLSPRQSLDVVAQRGTETITTTLVPEPKGTQELGITGLVPQQPIIITDIAPDSALLKAGVQLNDEIVTLNGEKVSSTSAIRAYLKNNGTKPVEVGYLRNGGLLTATVIPVEAALNGEKVYRLGFNSNVVHVDKLSFPDALRRSLEQNKKYAFLVVEMVQKMVQRKVSMKQMDGPIGIGRAAGEAVQQKGWVPFLMLMVAISLNLGVFNLLPIPILDGGLILMLLIESVIRRDINQRLKERIYQTAFVFLVIFAVFVFYNDFSKLQVFSKILP